MPTNYRYIHTFFFFFKKRERVLHEQQSTLLIQKHMAKTFIIFFYSTDAIYFRSIVSYVGKDDMGSRWIFRTLGGTYGSPKFGNMGFM